MKRRALSILSLLLFLCVVPAAPAGAWQAAPAPMRKFDFLVGRWSGSGWVEFVPGKRQEFVGQETIQTKAGGRVVLIEGVHRAKAAPDVIVHDALATITYDEASRQYRFRAYDAAGHDVETEAKLGDRSFTWTMPAGPGVTMRYTSQVKEDGTWVEVGEMSRDGATWRKFFEMTMVRAA